jgi:hypothetical protein
VTSLERAAAARCDLPAKLRAALALPEPARALRELLSSLGLADATREQLIESALLVDQRARERATQASASELELALGTVLALAGAVAPERGPGES